MKKIFLIIILIVIVSLTGCSSNNDKQIRNNFIKSNSNLNSYYMEGTLKITNNDDTYEYDVKTSYKKDDQYKVSMVNKANEYEQIILKNKDGVFVITPSLNKSFKFQSDWPNNNSQSYLIDSIVKDLKNDSKYVFTKKNKNYVFTIKPNYPNNPKYTKQNIILDSNENLKKVEVMDDDGVIYVEYIIKKISKNKKFSNNYFSLEEEYSNIEEQKSNENKSNENDEKSEDEEFNNEEKKSKEGETNSKDVNETSTDENNIFPLYLPSNTRLSDKEVINTKDGKRVIMTFSGDNPFILVEETVSPSDNLEIIPTYGEPFMLVDTVGSLTDTSYTWTSNGKEYYIASDNMDKTELLEVAKSINVMSVISKK